MDEVMIKANQFFNVIDPLIIKKCIDDYYSNSTFETDTMNKADTKNVLGLFTPMIENIRKQNMAGDWWIKEFINNTK